MFSCSSPPLRLPPGHCIGANPMAIHGLWLGPGQHVGTYDCGFSGHAGWATFLSLHLPRPANKDQGITFSPFILDRAASNDSGPESQHAFVVLSVCPLSTPESREVSECAQHNERNTSTDGKQSKAISKRRGS